MNYSGKLYGKGHGRTYFPLVMTSDDVDNLERQRNDLLVASRVLADLAERNTDDGDEWRKAIANVRAVIAKVEGGAS